MLGNNLMCACAVQIANMGSSVKTLKSLKRSKLYCWAGDLHILCPGAFCAQVHGGWEAGFEKRGSKQLLNVARLLDIVQLLFVGPRKLFFFYGCDLAFWPCTRFTLWPLLEVSQPLVQHSLQSPGEFRDSWYTHVAEVRAEQGNNWSLEAAQVFQGIYLLLLIKLYWCIYMLV